MKLARVLVWIGITVTFLFYFISLVLTLVWCAPPAGGSPVTSASAPSCQDKTQILSIIQAGFNICSDLYILATPLPVIYSLQMTTSRKVGIMVVFATGLL